MSIRSNVHRSRVASEYTVALVTQYPLWLHRRAIATLREQIFSRQRALSWYDEQQRGYFSPAITKGKVAIDRLNELIISMIHALIRTFCICACVKKR